MRAFVLHNSHHFYGSAPGFYVSAENDFENGGPELVAETAAECTTALGTVCPHAAGREIPLDPRRFARLAAFDLDTSAAVWEELRQLGYIDDQGNRLVEDITDMDAVMAGWESTARTPSPGSSSTQIRVVWATHRVTGEFAQAEAAWLVDHL
jgi:hypothetical protein